MEGSRIHTHGSPVRMRRNGGSISIRPAGFRIRIWTRFSKISERLSDRSKDRAPPWAPLNLRKPPFPNKNSPCEGLASPTVPPVLQALTSPSVRLNRLHEPLPSPKPRPCVCPVPIPYLERHLTRTGDVGHTAPHSNPNGLDPDPSVRRPFKKSHEDVAKTN